MPKRLTKVLSNYEKGLRNSISISEKFRKQHNFLTCILPDYVFHESLKEFWKNKHFEKMRASFYRRCQNPLWQTSHEMMHFQA